MPVLLIDEQSASVQVDDVELRAWAGNQRVFVSSLIASMPEERAAVRAAIEAVGARPVMFEDLGGQDVGADQAYLTGVRTSTIYVGLFGPRYGARLGSGYSATEDEYREAQRRGLRMSIYVKGFDGSDMDGGQRDLITGVRNIYTTSSWTSPQQLGKAVEQRLRDIAAETLTPWVKLDRTIFRATEIFEDSTTIRLTARIRSPRIHAELQAWRDRGRVELAYASSSDAQQVQFTDLNTTTRAGGSRDDVISLMKRGRSNPVGMMSSYSSGGQHYSAVQLARSRVYDAIFQTSTQPDRWSGPTPDILAGIRGKGLADSILRPVATLLITEYLIGQGLAALVDEVLLGPLVMGKRYVRVRWTPRKDNYSQADPDPVEIEGETDTL